MTSVQSVQEKQIDDECKIYKNEETVSKLFTEHSISKQIRIIKEKKKVRYRNVA